MKKIEFLQLKKKKEILHCVYNFSIQGGKNPKTSQKNLFFSEIYIYIFSVAGHGGHQHHGNWCKETKNWT